MVVSFISKTLVSFASICILLSTLFSSIPKTKVDISQYITKPTVDLHIAHFHSQFISFTTSDKITLQVLECNSHLSKQNDTIVFLHGFPESALLSFSSQIDYFCAKGYHVLAPDQRGYNNSDKPANVAQYHVGRLTLDIKELIIGTVGDKKPVYVVAHDWGVAVASSLTINFPHLVKKSVLLNMGHLGVYSKLATSDWSQASKSWYVLFFQIPSVSEKFLLQDNATNLFMGVGKALAQQGLLGYPLLERYVECWKKSLPNAIKWYRAIFLSNLLGKHMIHLGVSELEIQLLEKAKHGKHSVPVLYLFGDADSALSTKLPHLSLENATEDAVKTQSKVKYYPGVSHWVTHEIPEQVNQDIEAFIA